MRVLKIAKRIAVVIGAIVVTLTVMWGIVIGIYNNELSPYLARPVSDVAAIKLLICSFGIAILAVMLYLPRKKEVKKE